MILRTYGRRTRCGGRGFSEADLLDDGSDADEPILISQEATGSQADPYGFVAFSSQDSSPWSLDSDVFRNGESVAEAAAPALPPLPPLPPGNSSGLRRPMDRKGVKAKNPELPETGRPRSVPRSTGTVSAMATLMEAQEFGEMMEDVDEVNFALDGLRAGQPARIRQASLLSLLTICATAQRRRFLRAQGTSKRIIDSIVGLSVDDSASNLAASALFYVLASDVPDDCLMDSPSCIQYLLKLLNPPTAGSIQEKASNIGCRILGISSTILLSGNNKRIDSSSASIVSKVEEILLSGKEIKPNSQHDEAVRPELCSAWIALLTLEKACLSAVSIEDTSGTVGKMGGNFKERLRELGGLDTIFNVAASCYTTIEGMLKHGYSSFWEFKNGDLKSIMLLLKCFKIMENATFLSKENQDHLLRMTTKVENEGLSLSFVRLLLTTIKLFSKLSLNQTLTCTTMKKQSSLPKDDRSFTSLAYSRGHNVTEKTSDRKKPDSLQKRQRLSAPEFEVAVTESKSTVAFSTCNNKGSADVYRSKARTNPRPPVSNNGKFAGAKRRLNVNSKVSNVNPRRGTSGWISINLSKSKINSITHSVQHSTGTGVREKRLNGPKGVFSMNSNDSKASSVHLRKRDISTEGPKDGCTGTVHDPFTFEEVDGNSLDSNDARVEVRLGISKKTKENCTLSSLDPFAFDEDELGPSKWEMLATRNEVPENNLHMNFDWKMESGQEVFLVSDSETTEEESKSSDFSRPLFVEEEPNLLEDCLLSAVKVLMNLTNDNPIGCQQIALCGGLDTLASLITSHFPSFNFFQQVPSQLDEGTSIPKTTADAATVKDKYLRDYDLDFLVAILGLLVNLVEKDIQNRSRLASASVAKANSGRPEDRDNCTDVISLLCSIFLANRNVAEVEGEENLPCDEDAFFLQGEREAEMMIIEAYSALLLAFLSTESKKSREAIAGCLPDHNLEVLVPVLERFVAFHVSLNMISSETHSIVSEVIRSCKGS